MTELWIVLGVVAAASAAIKATGPVLVGGRELPPRALGVIALLAPALLTALVVTGTLAGDDGITLDARMAGLGACAAGLALRAPLLLCVVLAAAVTGGVRALG